MRAQRSRWLVRGGALFALLASCGNDEATGDGSPSAGKSGSCASCAGEASGGDGGTGTAAGGGEGGTPEALAGTSPTAGGSSGMGGKGGTGSTPGGEGGAGGEPPVGPGLEELTLCKRLDDPVNDSTKMDWAFEKLVYADCRVNWLNDLYLQFKPNKRGVYLDALGAWNQRFWGCQESPVGDFPLVFGTPPLSQGDADIVIGYYITAAIDQFALTKQEQEDMKGALERLATTVIVSESDEPSQPHCDEPAGGAGAGGASPGGAGGAGESLGGAGGAP